MKYLDEFRNTDAAAALADAIGRLAPRLGRRLMIMEVCGTHTMSIGRYGIRQMMPGNVELVSGPGCPVCVTDAGYIDAAVTLASGRARVFTFGDMLSVPGTGGGSLALARAGGGSVEVCYSPLDALNFARSHPGTETVFLAIGFETTAAAIVKMLDYACSERVGNLSLLVAFKRIIPAMDALLDDPELAIDAFICPAHVSAIIGADSYWPVAEKYSVPCVIAGFEPLDILYSIQGIIEMELEGSASVSNQYSRVVRPEGNLLARRLIDKYLEPCDASWRGLGTIPSSGYALRSEHGAYDASSKFGLEVDAGEPDMRCRCGDVLKGKIRPLQCGLFAGECRPEHPVGPCMVSAEGACSAYYKYGR